MEMVEGLLRAKDECNCDQERGDRRNLKERYEDPWGSPEVLVAADFVIPAEAVEGDEKACNYRPDGF